MLTHSPHLPLVVDYYEEGRDITTNDEEGIILALGQRDCILRVRLVKPVTSLRKLIAAMDNEYPILESLAIQPIKDERSTILMSPETLQAPHLRSLSLTGFALPIGLLTTAVGLFTLFLQMVHPSTYFQPNALLQWISFMPQLEMLALGFEFSIPSHDVERQPTHMPIIPRVTLPNLHHFRFTGVPSYLEALVYQITASRLETLLINFYSQLTFFVPHLLQFMNAAENLRFARAKLGFGSDGVKMMVPSREEAETPVLGVYIFCCHLDLQVSSMAEIIKSLSQVFSAVEHLTLEHFEHNLSSEEHNAVNCTEWRRLLRPLNNVKTLRIRNGLVGDLSRCLQSEDGEHPLTLPALQELTYDGGGNTRDAFTSFVNARGNTGRPITLIRRSLRPRLFRAIL